MIKRYPLVQKKGEAMHAVIFLAIWIAAITAITLGTVVICRWFDPTLTLRSRWIRLSIAWTLLVALGVAGVIQVEREEAQRRSQVEHLTRLLVRGRSPEA